VKLDDRLASSFLDSESTGREIERQARTASFTRVLLLLCVILVPLLCFLHGSINSTSFAFDDERSAMWSLIFIRVPNHRLWNSVSYSVKARAANSKWYSASSVVLLRELMARATALSHFSSTLTRQGSQIEVRMDIKARKVTLTTQHIDGNFALSRSKNVGKF
jgi:hypothetical protein